MGNVYPDWRYPQVDDREGTNVLRPTLAAGLQGMASIVNHMIALRAKRQVHHRVEYERNNALTGLKRIRNESPIGVSDTTRLWWKSHELSEQVFIAFVYQATTDPALISPPATVKVDATLLLKSTGAILDAPDAASVGVSWSAPGSLSVSDRIRDTNQLSDGTVQLVYAYPFQMAHTGATPDPDIAAPYPNGPRPLVIPAANAGDWLVLELTTTNVRLISVDVWELPASPTVF